MKRVKRIRLNGARGVCLLGFGLICLMFGIAFFGGEWLGPLKLYPPPMPGLQLVTTYGGLRFWGTIWLMVGFYLLFAAFRQDHAYAMAGFAFMCFIWGASYIWAFIEGMLIQGESRFWLSGSVFIAMLIACLGIARMLNAPPLNMEGLENALDHRLDELPRNEPNTS